MIDVAATYLPPMVLRHARTYRHVAGSAVILGPKVVMHTTLSACTPLCTVPRLSARPVFNRPQAAMVRCTTFDFVCDREGQKLVATEYLPDHGAPSAYLVWHHGVAEHSGRYTAGALIDPLIANASLHCN